MSPPISELFVIRDADGAGRGVFATQTIPQGKLILRSPPPAAHVLFRDYRKEVCAYCFHYNLGRTLPVRDQKVGKVFCSDDCHDEWAAEQGAAAILAWQAVNAIPTAKGGHDVNMLNGSDSDAADNVRPSREDIEAAWASAAIRVAERAKLPEKKQQSSLPGRSPELHHVGYFLDGIIALQRDEMSWQQRVESLAADEQPYTDHADLHSHCEAYEHLAHAARSLLISPEACRMLVAVGSHNAFGIRAGSEDAEEYMGYSLYPEASYFNHSCRPNVAKRRVGRRWEFRAAREIRLGEQCYISYLGGDENSLSVSERWKRLDDVWRFKCACEKCSSEMPCH